MDNSKDLFSFFDDADLAELMASDSADAKRLFESTLKPTAIEEALKKRQLAAPELDAPLGLAPPAPLDPSLPEIVLLHGITDSHLANTSGRRNRIWLDYLELLKGRYTRYLTLQADGESDQPGVALETDGPIAKKYDKALEAWQERGFATHMFCYDWRQSVRHAAVQLDQFLQNLPAVAANRKVILVCHSMGGLVASAYAAEHSSWESVVEHAVLVGSPLGGAYSAAIAIMGKSPSFKKMGLLSLTESLEDFQRMAASFPGLVDLLPNPDVFPEAKDLYSQSGWPGSVQPTQQWLDNSLALKETIWNSPLFAKSTHLVSQDFPTVSEMPWNAKHDDRASDVHSPLGDGAVLNRSSLAPGLKAYKIPGAHAMLCAEQQVIDAVIRIAKGDAPQLPTIELEDLNESPTLEVGDQPFGLAGAGPASTRSLGRGNDSGLVDEVSNKLLSKSDASRGALLGLSGDTGQHSFDRTELRDTTHFSWQNALSLAIASEVAYKQGAELFRIATNDWGFDCMQAIEAGNHQGFIAWDDDVAVLSFRGTENNLNDWLGNFNVFGSDWGQFGEVHGGFLSGFKGLKPEIDSIFDTINAATKRVWITGHSLGGALAVLAGAAYQASHDVAGIYTYGQPKLGGQPIADFYEQNYGNRYVRFVNNEDAVPMVPPGYQHFGRLVWFDENGNEQSPAIIQDGPMGLAAPRAASEDGQATSKELTAEEFKQLQEGLAENGSTRRADDEPFGLALPSFGIRDRVMGALGISFSDHSVRDAYIPIITRQL